jgi:hypothetical protein
MTQEEFDYLRFNMPVYSNIDGTTWLYDCSPNGRTVKIFKELLDTTPDEREWGGRTVYGNRWTSNRDPWERNGALTIPMTMFMEDFDVIVEVEIQKDVEFVKKIKHLMEPYSLVKPNFHMMDLPF